MLAAIGQVSGMATDPLSLVHRGFRSRHIRRYLFSNSTTPYLFSIVNLPSAWPLFLFACISACSSGVSSRKGTSCVAKSARPKQAMFVMWTPYLDQKARKSASARHGHEEDEHFSQAMCVCSPYGHLNGERENMKHLKC